MTTRVGHCEEAGDRRMRLSARVRALFEDVTGVEIAAEEGETPFVELGMDSLILTQVAVQLGRAFAVRITFRQLMEDCASVDQLVSLLDGQLPPDPTPDQSSQVATGVPGSAHPPPSLAGDADLLHRLIRQQTQLMARQLAVLSECSGAGAAGSA